MARWKARHASRSSGGASEASFSRSNDRQPLPSSCETDGIVSRTPAPTRQPSSAPARERPPSRRPGGRRESGQARARSSRHPPNGQRRRPPLLFRPSLQRPSGHSRQGSPPGPRMAGLRRWHGDRQPRATESPVPTWRAAERTVDENERRHLDHLFKQRLDARAGYHRARDLGGGVLAAREPIACECESVVNPHGKVLHPARPRRREAELRQRSPGPSEATRRQRGSGYRTSGTAVPALRQQVLRASSPTVGPATWAKRRVRLSGRPRALLQDGRENQQGVRQYFLIRPASKPGRARHSEPVHSNASGVPQTAHLAGTSPFNNSATFLGESTIKRRLSG